MQETGGKWKSGTQFPLAVVPAEDILCGMEKVIGVWPETAEEVQQETVRILKGSCKPKENLTSAERGALRALKANNTLMVLPADKGNVTVVLDTADYNQKIPALLEDKAYKKLKKTILLLNTSSISEEVYQQLRPQGSRPPRLYGLPKIHKQGAPLRPMVSTIGDSTYCLAKHLVDLLLGSHIGNSPHHVKNLTDFVCTLGSLCVGCQDIMVSFNVVLLLTKVTIRETMSLLGRHFEDIQRLFRHVLTASHFSYAGQFYKQIDGVAMSSPNPPVIANFFMEDFKKMVVDCAAHKPLCWFC
jgi:hypothetical protein